MNRKTRLMVVDDDDDLRGILKLVLEGADYDVCSVASGEAAIEILPTYQPDLILLDIRMPNGWDGWKTLAHIRAQYDTPVIMLTVVEGTENRARGLDGGADDYIHKTADHRELIARIQTVLRRSNRAPKLAGKVQVGWVEIDLDNDCLNVSGKTIAPPIVAWRILRTLALHKGNLISIPEVIQAAWYGEPVTPQRKQLVKAEIFKLRKMLNDTGRPPQLIHAKYRKGYCLDYRPREK